MHDLILTGGRLLDPAAGIDARRDIAFAGGKVAEVAPDLAAAPARERRDVSGLIVVPGLIDLHTHVYWGGTALGVEPEPVARRSGTTTFVDAGSAGAGNIAGMCRHVIAASPLRVLAFLNVSFAGIFAFSREVMVGECDDMRLIHPSAAVAAGREHASVVTGIKVRVGRHAGGVSGVAPLDIALQVADALGVPVMAHIDHPPPSLREVLGRLRPGDILTHCYRPFPNAPVDGSRRVLAEVTAARERGVVFDIGHGTGSFGFATARAMLAEGVPPDVISSDIHTLSIDGPAFDVLMTMSKFLCLGMELPEVVRRATANAAAALRRTDLGTLAPGAAGDAALLEVERGDFTYSDVIGETLRGDRRLRAAGIVLGGRWWHPGDNPT